MSTKTSIRTAPTPEEAAAIVAALAVVHDEKARDSGEYKDTDPKRQRWRLAGLIGGPPPRGIGPDGSLWSYSSWERTV